MPFLTCVGRFVLTTVEVYVIFVGQFGARSNTLNSDFDCERRYGSERYASYIF